MRQDERVARALAEVHGFDGAIETHFQPSAVCPHESACRRTDAKHFETMYHPPAVCPLCAQEFAVYEVEAHVNLCLQGRGAVTDKSAGAARHKMELDDDDGQHKHKEHKSNLAEHKTQGATKPLSLQQLSALSREILNRTGGAARTTAEKKKASKDDDVGLCDLLDTFKALGLDKDSLKEAVHTHQHARLPAATTTAGSQGLTSVFAGVVLSAAVTHTLSGSMSASVPVSLSTLSTSVSATAAAGTRLAAEAVALSMPEDL